MAGWIKLHRDIQSHWIWNIREPFDKRSAWVDLLLLANHRDFKTTRKNIVVARKRGEVNTSLGFLAERWMWDKRKVKRYLMALQSDGMVSLNSTTDGTTVTIENYDVWQSSSTTDGSTDGTTHGTTHGTTDGTHDKKDKEYKELNNIISMTRAEKDEWLRQAHERLKAWQET